MICRKLKYFLLLIWVLQEILHFTCGCVRMRGINWYSKLISQLFHLSTTRQLLLYILMSSSLPQFCSSQLLQSYESSLNTLEVIKSSDSSSEAIGCHPKFWELIQSSRGSPEDLRADPKFEELVCNRSQNSLLALRANKSAKSSSNRGGLKALRAYPKI